MRRICLWVLLAAFAGGCAETVSAEKFLYMYRRSAPPGHMEEGWYADYTGWDDQYHYLKVQSWTLDRGAAQVFRYGAYREEIFRCPLSAFSVDFRNSLRTLYQDGKRSESDEDTYSYIREYLRGPSASEPAPAEYLRGPSASEPAPATGQGPSP
jgi:hypothetical protein